MHQGNLHSPTSPPWKVTPLRMRGKHCFQTKINTKSGNPCESSLTGLRGSSGSWHRSSSEEIGSPVWCLQPLSLAEAMLVCTVWIRAAGREASGQPLVLPTVTLKVLAGTRGGLAAQNRSLWTDLKPFLSILPVFGKRDWKTTRGTSG